MVPVLAAFAALFWLVHAGGAALPHGGGAWAWALRLAAAAALGVCQALPLLHVMHDASHGAVGGPATWDVVGQGAFDWFAGGSVAAWHHQHVLGHHVYTNVFLADPDLPAVSAGDLRRLVPAQAGHAAYAYQHWYLPLLYGLLALKVRFSDVYDFMYRRMSGPVRVNLPRAVLGRLLLAKAAWLAWRVVMPLALWRMPAAHFAACFLVTDVVTGFWLAYNVQVSHISGDAAWPNGGGEGESGTLRVAAVKGVHTELHAARQVGRFGQCALRFTHL
jgi:fatty acid desaturase